MSKIFKTCIILFVCFFATACYSEYTSYDYEIMIEELEHELEYKNEQISILENKLQDCEDHYYECFSEAQYCGCTEDLSRYDYYDFEN